MGYAMYSHSSMLGIIVSRIICYLSILFTRNSYRPICICIHRYDHIMCLTYTEFHWRTTHTSWLISFFSRMLIYSVNVLHLVLCVENSFATTHRPWNTLLSWFCLEIPRVMSGVWLYRRRPGACCSIVRSSGRSVCWRGERTRRVGRVGRAIPGHGDSNRQNVIRSVSVKVSATTISTHGSPVERDQWVGDVLYLTARNYVNKQHRTNRSKRRSINQERISVDVWVIVGIHRTIINNWHHASRGEGTQSSVGVFRWQFVPQSNTNIRLIVNTAEFRVVWTFLLLTSLPLWFCISLLHRVHGRKSVNQTRFIIAIFWFSWSSSVNIWIKSLGCTCIWRCRLSIW